MRIGDYSLEITDTNMVLRDPAGDELVMQPLSLDIVDGLKEIVSQIVEEYGPEEPAAEPEADLDLGDDLEEPGELELDLDLDFEPEGEVKRPPEDDIPPTPPGEQLTEEQEQEATPREDPEGQVVTGYLSSIKQANDKFFRYRDEIADKLERSLGADQSPYGIIKEYRVLIDEELREGKTPDEIAEMLVAMSRP